MEGYPWLWEVLVVWVVGWECRMHMALPIVLFVTQMAGKNVSKTVQ